MKRTTTTKEFHFNSLTVAKICWLLILSLFSPIGSFQLSSQRIVLEKSVSHSRHGEAKMISLSLSLSSSSDSTVENVEEFDSNMEDDGLSDNAGSNWMIHHTAVKTRNITLAMQFYSLLGFEPTVKFRAGPAKAAWLEIPNPTGSSSSRIEIIEVPPYMLREPEGMKRRAIDLGKREDLLGYNHMALDVTTSIKIEKLSSLSEWMDKLNERSINTFGKSLRIALEPKQQMIGQGAYEVAFLYDADGALVELLNKQADLPQQVSSGWTPWDGTGFVGPDGKSQ